MDNTSSSKIPSWLWRPVSVPNLHAIQQELLPVLKDWPVWPPFIHVDTEVIKKASPLYVQLIDSLGLADRWCVSAITTGYHERMGPIHVDHFDPMVRSVAFNIPILNCEDSWTAFYDAKNPRPNTVEPEDGKYVTMLYDNDGAVEIGRLPAETCAFINVTVPHRAVVNHKKFRAVLSSRFYPELFDYFD